MGVSHGVWGPLFFSRAGAPCCGSVSGVFFGAHFVGDDGDFGFGAVAEEVGVELFEGHGVPVVWDGVWFGWPLAAPFGMVAWGLASAFALVCEVALVPEVFCGPGQGCSPRTAACG